ncbi:aminoacyl-tRNA deacylase [Microlunatus capsulatus]|uniref:Prolyl-tRNA editing enzyme YbaK/EbsC (Cys-tRNA(Pro) deacylase) n=1 Tax=Microlunatus capsulatus TaxID=99117 RepID=A0ABS4ZAK9_9ACTN|nr:YbaK/EbsC family protein [Microlunatus capsulatus]MBP2418024.1 prolyl-tRNA editing enzyme YbaK/EbsC (Cys-tRNA(Pro) deacylase) [Microlunatus capsulatus]
MSDLAQTWPDGVERMLAGARAHGLAVEVRPRPPARSLPEAAALLGLTPADIAKTLVLRRSDGSYLFAVLPGDTQLAWPKLRALVGVNKLTLPDAGEALAATGYARGTITPVGSSTAWPLWVDARLAGRRVAMGAGDHGYSAFVDVDALVTAYGGVVADLAEPAG